MEHRVWIVCGVLWASLLLAGCPLRPKTPKAPKTLQERSSSFAAKERDAWSDGTAEKLLRRAAKRQDPGTKACLKKEDADSYADANCAYTLMAAGDRKQRLRILHTMILAERRGKAAVMVLLGDTHPNFQRLLAEHILVYAAYSPLLPVHKLGLIYKDNPKVFPPAFARLDKKTRLLAALRLVAALEQMKRPDLDKELKALIKFPAGWYWRKMKQERDLERALHMLELRPAVRGKQPYEAAYHKASASLYTYARHWEALKKLLVSSGMLRYKNALRRIREGKKFLVEVPLIKESTVKRVLEMTRRYFGLQAKTKQDIARIKKSELRQQLHTWYEQVRLDGVSIFMDEDAKDG